MNTRFILEGETMLDTNLLPDTLSNINHLLAYLHDSHKGYKHSANIIEDDQLEKELINAAARREKMIDTLESVIANNNQKPTQHGTLSGAVHRIFVDLKSLVTGHNPSTTLREIERGENILIQEYHHTLEKISHPEMHQLLQKQLSSIQEDLNQWEIINLKAS